MTAAFPGLYGEESSYLDAEGLEPGEIVPGRPFLGPAIEWPKVSVTRHDRDCCKVGDAKNGRWLFYMDILKSVFDV